MTSNTDDVETDGQMTASQSAGAVASAGAGAGAGRHAGRRLLGALLGSLQRNRVLVTLIALHFIIANLVAEWLGVPFTAGIFALFWLIFALLSPAFVFALLLWRFLWLAMVERPAQPIKRMASDIRDVLTTPGRLIDGFLTLGLFALFCGSFGFLKSLIPLFDRFSWDPFFAHADRMLLGGYDAYQLLLPLVSPLAVSIINDAYDGWLFLMFFIFFVASFTTSDRASRNTFLISFVLTWAIGGNLIATLFASAGPVYYHDLGFGNTFVPLMKTLHQFNAIAPISSLRVQDFLWQSYLHDHNAAGISAFPSMHIASTTLLTLYAFRYRRWAGRLMCLFLAVMIVGSVLLGWHYLVDAIGGAGCAVLFWAVAARLSGPRVQAPAK